jgi:flagellar motility protein MotE (MotC chaperone)
MVAVGVAGLLAVKALAGAEALPALLGSPARAEGKAPAKPAAKPAAKAAPGSLEVIGPAAAPAPRPAQACLPTAAVLAKEAGMSPTELRVLQSLGERRGQLDSREQAIDTQSKLLTATELKLDAKIKALMALKAEMQALVATTSTQQKEEANRLVAVYEKMKPKDAAPIMSALDDKVRLPVAAQMKPQTLASILANMEPNEAKKLTEKLAERYARAEATAAKASEALRASGVRPAS